jgi:hypothetical protein
VKGWCDHGTEPSGYVKDEELLNRFRDPQLFKNFAPWNLF